MFIIYQKLRHVQVTFKKNRASTYSETFKEIPQSVHSLLSTTWKTSNLAGFLISEFCHLMILVKSHPFYKALDLQLSFYRPLFYKCSAHCPLLQCLHTNVEHFLWLQNRFAPNIIMTNFLVDNFLWLKNHFPKNRHPPETFSKFS
jgi:hypothetical protein